MMIKTSTSHGREDWTAKFEIKEGRAIGALFYQGRIVRRFDLAISMHNYIEVPLEGTRKKVRFKTTEDK